MKKLVLLIAVTLLVFSCASDQVKEETAATPSSDMLLEQSNKQLAKVPYEDFEYGSASVPTHKYDKWATAAAPVIKKVLDSLPDGYSLYIVGHTDATVSKKPKRNYVTNQKLSEMRAKAVYDALRRKGITSNKLKYKGVGTSDPVAGTSPDDPKNRRVTFEAVKSN